MHIALHSTEGKDYRCVTEIVHWGFEITTDAPARSISASAAARGGLAPRMLFPFNLESFLGDEAKIDDGVRGYLPLLKKNKVDEAGLHLLTDAMLLKWGIEADLDRAKILDAAKQRTSGKRQ